MLYIKRKKEKKNKKEEECCLLAKDMVAGKRNCGIKQTQAATTKRKQKGNSNSMVNQYESKTI